MRINTSSLYIIAWLMAFWRWDCVTVISTLLSINSSLLNIFWLFITVLVLLVGWIKKDLILNCGIFPLILMVVLYAISLCLAFNDCGFGYFQNFIRYVILGSVLLMQIDENQIEKALDYYCWSCVFAFLAFGFLPFTGSLDSYMQMAYFETGMAYGESVITPCFIGIYVLYKRLNKIPILLLAYMCLALGFILANRSTTLVCLFFIVAYSLWIDENNVKKIVLYVLCGILVLIVYYNIQMILEFLNNYLSSRGIHSYALTKYENALNNNSTNFMSGREDTVGLGIAYFKENPIFGIGFGTFNVRTGEPYVHNVFVDWFSTLGVVGGSIFVIMTLWAIWKMHYAKEKRTKMFLLVLLCLWFPKLLFSKTFADNIEYWCFITYMISRRKSFFKSSSSIQLFYNKLFKEKSNRLISHNKRFV